MDILNTNILGITNLYQILIIIHLIGLAIGAGAAFYSDFFFSSILKDKIIDKKEYEILKLTSRVVWLGLIILVLSGAFIFINDFERLKETSKFLAKISIVGVLIINGIAFHFFQIPRLKKFAGKNLAKNKEFMSKYANKFFIGGAVSGVSWAAALVLGSLDYLKMEYIEIMFIYVAVLFFAGIASYKVKDHLLS